MGKKGREEGERQQKEKTQRGLGQSAGFLYTSLSRNSLPQANTPQHGLHVALPQEYTHNGRFLSSLHAIASTQVCM